jgi:hypothetical protein
MIGYDTPEVVTPGRRVGPDERAVATIAKERFVELLGSGSLDLTEVRCSCSTKIARWHMQPSPEVRNSFSQR